MGFGIRSEARRIPGLARYLTVGPCGGPTVRRPQRLKAGHDASHLREADHRLPNGRMAEYHVQLKETHGTRALYTSIK